MSIVCKSKKVCNSKIILSTVIILGFIFIIFAGKTLTVKAEYEIRFEQFERILREEELFKDATDEELEKEFKVWLNNDGYLDICLDKENNCLVKINYSGDNPDWQPR